jgi:hypothetical protein
VVRLTTLTHQPRTPPILATVDISVQAFDGDIVPIAALGGAQTGIVCGGGARVHVCRSLGDGRRGWNPAADHPSDVYDSVVS